MSNLNNDINLQVAPCCGSCVHGFVEYDYEGCSLHEMPTRQYLICDSYAPKAFEEGLIDTVGYILLEREGILEYRRTHP